jgi:hypothetical protein
MDNEIDAFREEVTRLRGGRSRGAGRYTDEMAARGRALAQRLEAAGEPKGKIAIRLGIADRTLTKWMTGTAGFLAVAVNEAKPARAAEIVKPGVRIISPRGYQVDGLDAATAMQILRELG